MANVTPFTTAAFFCILISWIIIIVAMAGTSWVKVDMPAQVQTADGSSSASFGYDKLHSGLLSSCMCGQSTCTCTDTLEHSPDWIKATLAAVCLAFIGNFLAIVTISLFVVNIGKLSTLRIASLAFVLFAIAWNLLAVIIFGAKYHEYNDQPTSAGLDYQLGWTFGMPLLAIVLELFGLGFTAMIKNPDAGN